MGARPRVLGPLVLTAGATAMTALPDWVPQRRVRWPMQGALSLTTAMAYAVLTPERLAPGTGTRTTDEEAPSAEQEQAAGSSDWDEQSLPAAAQGLDQPDIRVSPATWAVVGGLAVASVAGGFALEHWLVRKLAARGVEHPCTALALGCAPLAFAAAVAG
ncbi:hypothetical protein [Kytococcus sp. Marseille-QA3725]